MDTTIICKSTYQSIFVSLVILKDSNHLLFLLRSNNPQTKSNKEIVEQVRSTTEESVATRKDRPRAEEEGLEYEYKDELDVLRRKERLTVDSTNTQYMTVVFNGEFDRDILTYPELLTKSESTQMNTLCERLKKFTDSIDRKKIERDNQIDKEIYQEMAKLKLYGLSIPEEFGKIVFFFFFH